MKKNIKIQLVLGFIAMLAFTQSTKAQTTLITPFAIINSLPCDIVVSYEISDCVVNFFCGSGTFIIPAGGTYNITGGSPCPLTAAVAASGDVFVYVWEVGASGGIGTGFDVTPYWPTVSCNCGCLSSQGTSYSLPAGTIPTAYGCGGIGSFTMQWSNSNVKIF
ncbi:MAG: hypothetical protein KF900_03440 [Bacteroidetes bacterium]|nr:hypothetical protein [Bacteroidota bacterium]